MAGCDLRCKFVFLKYIQADAARVEGILRNAREEIDIRGPSTLALTDRGQRLP